MQSTPIRLGVLLVAALACACSSDDPTGSSTPTGPSASALSSASCATSVAGVPNWVPGEGGRFALAVTAASACTWTASTDVTWASVSPVSGSGNGSAMLTVNRNFEVGDSRTANVTIGNQRLHLSQANACVYAIDRASADVDSDGENILIAITTTTGCPWTNNASESWLRVLPASGSSSGVVRIEIAPNMGGLRHAVAMVAGLRVQVTQQGR